MVEVLSIVGAVSEFPPAGLGEGGMWSEVTDKLVAGNSQAEKLFWDAKEPGFRLCVWASGTGPPPGVVMTHERVNEVPMIGCVLGHLYGFEGDSQVAVSGLESWARTCILMWKAEGPRFLRRLNGSFAILLHDSASRESLVSVDRFATRSIWVARWDHYYAISPDVRTLAGVLRGQLDLDPASLWSFLARGHTVGNRSLFLQIRAVPPGTALRFNRGELVDEIVWWRPSYEPQHGRSVTYWAGRFTGALKGAISDKMEGCRSPGLLLSGGLDSRLVAALAPENTMCITLSDAENLELRLARLAARVARKEHITVIRDRSWYPDMIEEAAIAGNGLFFWNQAHYIPLPPLLREQYGIERISSGFGIDTFFKGLRIGYLPGQTVKLALAGHPIPLDQLVDLVVSCAARPATGAGHIALRKFLRPQIYARCEEAYREAARAEFEIVSQLAENPLDQWEAFHFRACFRVPEVLNMICLRSEMDERNAVFDNRLYDLHLVIPASFRHGGDLVRSAIMRLSVPLSLVLYSNTLLPAFAPKAVHQAFSRIRVRAGEIKDSVLIRLRSSTFTGAGGWPHFSRLWVVDRKLVSLMDSLVHDEEALPSEIFSLSTIQEIWHNHKEGKVQSPKAIDAIASFALFHRRFPSRANV
jgi:asparagine synthetase B (glutamine-hydrolysing)